MRRQIPRKDLGEAISIEDALSLLTVIFVLFILFFVPLVNIDRMRLEQARQDTYWPQLAQWLRDNGAPVAERKGLQPYLLPFALDGSHLHSAEDGALVRVEALDSDSTLTVIEHHQEQGSYTAMVVKGDSPVVTFRRGSLRWSAAEGSWFTSGDSIDYGDRPQSRATLERYRAWSKSVRSF